MIRNTLTYLSTRGGKTLRLITGAAGIAVLAGVVTFTAVAATPTAHAAANNAGIHYQRGYSLQGSWFCYGWPNGYYRCTAHWHRSGGQIISDNPAWVPNNGAVTTTSSSSSHGSHSAPAPAPVSHPSGTVQGSTSAGEPCRSTDYFNGYPSQWEVPPSCYAGIYYVNPANYVSRPGFGWCNWWVEVMNPGRPDLLWGPYRRGTVPVPGATVVFAGGVQGASAEGHYARVVAVYPGGQWMLVSEMNFYWRGGGWQKVSYRYVHTGPGVTFIY